MTLAVASDREIKSDTSYKKFCIALSSRSSPASPARTIPQTGGILRYSSSSFDSSETTDLYYSIDSRIVEAVDNVLEERYVEITIRFVGAEEVQEPISTQLATRNSVGDTYAIGLEVTT